MNLKILSLSLLSLLSIYIIHWQPTLHAQTKQYPKAKVSFEDFKSLVSEVEPIRAKRLVDLDTFLKMSKEPGTIVLDSRSTFRFERIHIKGAKHLSFTDFTQDNLAKVIPSFDTKVLIYCNNNFEGNQVDFASKIADPRNFSSRSITTQLAAQAKPIMMALNIPTYINLYGYGYTNVYELDELVNVTDPRIEFEGTIVGSNSLQGLSEKLNTMRWALLSVFSRPDKSQKRPMNSEKQRQLRVVSHSHVVGPIKIVSNDQSHPDC